jgi:hypothetical protein
LTIFGVEVGVPPTMAHCEHTLPLFASRWRTSSAPGASVVGKVASAVGPIRFATALGSIGAKVQSSAVTDQARAIVYGAADDIVKRGDLAYPRAI